MGLKSVMAYLEKRLLDSQIAAAKLATQPSNDTGQQEQALPLKEVVVDATNAEISNVEKPELDPVDALEHWYVIDRIYQSHHFGCPICIAAGKGYGLRCGTGAALWRDYEATPKPDWKPKRKPK